jgi:hypothetical protein
MQGQPSGLQFTLTVEISQIVRCMMEGKKRAQETIMKHFPAILCAIPVTFHSTYS